MTVTVPPRKPDTDNDRDLEQRVADLEALIEEARRRARRRRRLYGAAVLAAIAAGVAAAFGIGGGGGVSLATVAEGSLASPATQTGQGNWRPLGGPQGGQHLRDGNRPGRLEVVYAAGWGRVFKSQHRRRQLEGRERR